MNRSIIREVLLYRYRYVAAIVVFSVVLVGLLTLRIDLAPSGISSLDMQSTVRSANLNLSKPFDISTIDLPYMLLQKLSLHFLGITDFAIVLPSIVLAVVTGYAFLLMASRWFRPNVALITSLIFITSSGFLTLGRSGHGAVMTTFWLSLILLAATNIIHPAGKTKTWVIAGLVLLPLSLYTPLMVYPIAAIAIAGLLHPHVRFSLRQIKPWQFVAIAMSLALLLAPLVINIVVRPNDGLVLLGAPNHVLTATELLVNLKSVTKSFLNLGGAVVGSIPQPIFGAASFIIIVLGFLRTVSDRHSARSYMLLIWSVMFVPLAIINPGELLICLVPAYLYMAIGVETLIREWYKLFPNNPYARLTGLVPLVILMGGIMLSNTAQYFYGYFFGTPATQYHQQLSATRRVIEKNNYKGEITTLITKSSDIPFYDLMRRDYPRMNVTGVQNVKVVRPTIVHDGASIATSVNPVPKTIVTSYTTKSDQVILRVYTP